MRWDKLSVFLAVLAIIFAIYNYGRFVEPLVLLRTPIILGLFLIVFPLLALTIARNLLANMFILSSKIQIFLALMIALISAISVVTMIDVHLETIPQRYGPDWGALPAATWSTETLLAWAIWFLVPLALAAPIAVAVLTSSRDSLAIEQRRQALYWSLPLLLVWIILIPYLSASDFRIPMITDALSFVAGSVLKLLPEAKGYLDDTGSLVQGHARALTLLTLAAIIYLLGLFFRPPKKRLRAPTLCYVLIIILAVSFIYAGVAFYLDLYRIPSLLSLLVLSVIIYWLRNVDHVYPLTQSNGSKPDFDPVFQQALEKRLSVDDNGERQLVVICASGGGIHAAAWTTQVLIGLQRKLGPSFTKSIGLISSVSGGSVGTIFYLDRFNDNGYPDEDELEPIYRGATSNSLDATGWGWAYVDLWRPVSFLNISRFFKREIQDRGWATEVAWRQEMKDGDVMFADWREKILQGILPTPVFNATLVQDGTRYLLSPMPMCHKNDSEHRRDVDFNSLFPKHDILASTAARLSATFPYVTPIARNSVETAQKGYYHVADGGFFDNFGVFTSVEWIDDVLTKLPKLNIKKVMILELHAFPKAKLDDATENARNQGWRMAFFGPLQTLASVRGSTQTARNQREIVSLKQRWKSKPESEQVDIESFVLEFPNEEFKPPLSWKLAEREKMEIQRTWETSTQLKESIDEIEQVWQTWQREK